VYGPNDRTIKPLFLDEIRTIHSWCMLEPWALMGDFNMTRFMDGCQGCEANIVDMDFFNDLIRDLGLIHIPLGGDHSLGPTTKFDRFLISDSWKLSTCKLSLIPFLIIFQSPSIPPPLSVVLIDSTSRVCDWNTVISMILWLVLGLPSPMSMSSLD